jgi:hypothetical protein
MVYPYKIDTQEDLLKLSELACKEDFPIYISTPYGQIDARSLLGLFTVVGQDINLVAPDHSCAKAFSKFINKLEEG